MTPEIDLSNWKNAVAIYYVDQTGKIKSAKGRLGVHFWTCQLYVIYDIQVVQQKPFEIMKLVFRVEVGLRDIHLQDSAQKYLKT